MFIFTAETLSTQRESNILIGVERTPMRKLQLLRNKYSARRTCCILFSAFSAENKIALKNSAPSRRRHSGFGASATAPRAKPRGAGCKLGR